MSTIKTTCEICKKIRYTEKEPTYKICRYCRASEEFSQANPARCMVCSREISKTSKSNRCRNCAIKKTNTNWAKEYKIRLNNIPSYPLSEIKNFVDSFEMDFNRMQPNEYLLQMLNTLKYYESTVLIGYENMLGTPNEQLRKMYEQIYKYVYKNRKKK